jgi:methyltransferase-like protein/2-polyprenyl-3-methyl-5-hydroxy-6-metoxy-1,4-benzoquinol methylase
MERKVTEYDRVPYPSYTHPQTHPDRLAVIGKLFGLEPALITQCRVLEVGCGDGTNLAPMAWALPKSQFLGIDLSVRPIRRGQQMVQDLGITNLRLLQANLTEIGPELGRFDYIIAHGLFSWVPKEVREHLFTVCRQLMAPTGVAFISYNAFPGCHLRNMLRELMLFHLRGCEGSEVRVQQAMALVRFLAEAQDTHDEYRLWMKAELERVREHDSGHLYHDELAEINEPLYFTQFIADAARHGLQYLGEADYFEMSDHIFHDSVRETLRRLAQNRLLREQYLDFLKCRRFRQTLLCHKEVTLQTEPLAERIAGFFIASGAVSAGGTVDFKRGINCVFESPRGAKCQTDLPAGKAALSILGCLWPAPLRFEELMAQVRQLLENTTLREDALAVSPQVMCDFLLRLYEGGVVEFRTWLPPIANHVEERPVAYPVARWQATNGNSVASLFHTAVKIEDEVGRCLLSWLDGTLNRTALLGRLWDLLKSKNALSLPGGDELAARKELEIKLEENLRKLAKMGLLVGSRA